jgi:hypothetical protein
MNNIISKFITSFKLLISGNVSKFLSRLKYNFLSIRDTNRIKNLLTSISEDLFKNQNDYRLIVYKNFDYKYSFFREVFKKNGSDKGGENRSQNNKIIHFYGEFYEETLKDLKVNNLLELGIGQFKNELPGASIRAWKEIYPEAKIHATDIRSELLFKEKNIETYYVDQFDRSELLKLKEKFKDINFEVIVDDGSHIFEANILSFEILYEKLADNGFYFIEDVKYLDLKKYYKYLNKRFNFKIVECFNININYAQCIVAVKKS